MFPGLSIITVNLNNRDGLIKTIESVVNQSFSDFEFIVIDGGSSDGSTEIIEVYSDKIAWWVSEPDSGIYNAMNKGIRRAKGDYLLFLNSGDFLVDCEVLGKILQHNFTEDIVIGDCNVSQNGQVIFKAVPPDQISFTAFYNRTIPHQSAFIRKDLLYRFGFYSEKYRIHSDLEFFIKSLIINNCSYRHLPVTISDYNLEGISTKEGNNSILRIEYDAILNNLIPPRITFDYANWSKEQNEMNILYWIKTKPLLYKPLTWIFQLATCLAPLRKRTWHKL